MLSTGGSCSVGGVKEHAFDRRLLQRRGGEPLGRWARPHTPAPRCPGEACGWGPETERRAFARASHDSRAWMDAPDPGSRRARGVGRPLLAPGLSRPSKFSRCTCFSGPGFRYYTDSRFRFSSLHTQPGQQRLSGDGAAHSTAPPTCATTGGAPAACTGQTTPRAPHAQRPRGPTFLSHPPQGA